MSDRTIVRRVTDTRAITRNQGPPGADGDPGDDGASAYAVAVANGFSGTEADWLASLVGETGPGGPQGEPGETGPSGPSGDTGPAGEDGRTLLNGSGAPANGTGSDGDFYLDTASTTLYGPKASGTWPTGVSLVGPAGNDGAQGAQGDPGADGLSVLNGSGAPSSGLGIDGDFYIDTAAWDIYGPKAAGAWGSATSLVGPQGIQGIQGDPGDAGSPGDPGTDGSVWRTGTGAPDNATGVDGDFYLDSASGDVYERVSGAYVLEGNLTGPAGAEGETGATGAPGQSGVSSGTYLVSGATIAWVSGFTYRIGAATYYVDGTLVSAAEQTVALTAADGSNPRIDVLVLDSTGTATKLTGTASASPAEPSVDPSLYLRLGVVIVGTAASAASVTETTIWKEDASPEWNATPSAGTIVVASTNNPRSGTKCIEGTNVAAGQHVDFAIDSGSIDVAAQDKHVFYIRTKVAWPTKKAIRLTWLASGVPVGSPVTVGNGLFGFNSQAPGAYQQIVVPSAAFAVPAGTAVTGLKWEIIGAGSSIGFYLDDVVLQAGLSTVAASQFRWRGTWAAGAAYAPNDAVSRSGATYLALQASLNKDPATATAYWSRLGWTADTVLYEDVGTGGGSTPTPGQDSAARTTYVATTGNDTTGDGTSGAPYATIAKALSTLPRSLGYVQMIDVADGTYAEGLSLEGFICTGAGKILITGNPTTPANVTFTGTVTSALRPSATTAGTLTPSCTVAARGKVVVELEGVRVNATADIGVLASEGAYVILDRGTVTGTLVSGVLAQEGGTVEFQGNVTVSGWSVQGIAAFIHATLAYTSAGTLTVTGPETAGTRGIRLSAQSNFQIYSGTSGLNVTVTGCEVAFALSFNSSFTHQGGSATITLDNVSTPSGSSGILCTDHANWSSTAALVLDHFTIGFEVNSMSYVESTGGRTLTNLGSTSSAGTGAVVNLV